MKDFDPIDIEFVVNRQQTKKETDAVKRDITGATDSAEKAVSRVNKTLDRQAKEWREVDQAAKSTNRTFQATDRATRRTKSGYDGLGNSINQLTREAPAFAVSTQTGILALSNNIPILADEIARLKVANAALVADGKKGVPVWKQLAKSFFSFGTLLSLGVTLITIYGKEIGEFFKSLGSGKKKVDELKESQAALNKAFASNEYKDALKSIQELKVNIELAKDGQIDATDVVEQYNSSLGKATGSAENLNEVEKLLTQNADKYVQMMLYKAAANIALDQAAQDAFETEQKRFKLQDDLEKAQAAKEKANSRPNQISGTGASSSRSNAKKRVNNLINQLARLDKASKESAEKRNKIFKALQEKASSFGLDFFLNADADDGKADKVVANRQRLLDRIADLDREFARKRLDDDAAELQALRDKFGKIRALVERFNADPNNKNNLINLGQLDSVQTQAERDLANRQSEQKAEKARKEAEKLAKIEQEKYTALLEKLMTYNEQKLAIEKKFNEDVALLAEKSSGDDFDNRVISLSKQKDAELKVIEDAIFKESDLYRQLNEEVLGKTREQITTQLALLKSALNKGFFTAADGTATKLTKAQISQLELTVTEIEKLLSDQNIGKAQQLAADFDAIGSALGNIGSALQETNPELADALETMSDLARVGSDATTSVAAFAAGDVVGGVTSAINAIAGLFSIGAKSRASARKAQEELLKIQNDIIDGERTLNQLQRERNLEKAREIELTLAGLKAQKEALELGQRQIQQDASKVFSELQQQSFVSGTRTKKTGGFLGIGRKSKVAKEYSSLLGKTFEEIERLFEQGKLEGRAAELFEQLRKLKAEGQDVEKQLLELQKQANEILTGTTANGISDGILQGLANGFTAVEDFAQDMERTLQNAILNAIKYQVLEEPLQELYKKFADFAASDGELTAEEADELREEYENNVQKAIDAYKQFSQIIDQDALNGGQERGLTGAIRRELTEATGSELAGLYRGQFDITKQHLELDENRHLLEQKSYNSLMDLVASNQLIEQHTRITAVRFLVAIEELKKIAVNTRPAQGSRDQGRG